MLHETEHYDGGVLTSRDVFDDDAGTFTTYDADGKQVKQRKVTAAEKKQLDANREAHKKAEADFRKLFGA